ncbi:pesticidal protein Cry26Aa [Corynebacterium yudongzhengii]|uniref:Pesticidal protein Cry26Aa n=1 Tax=Corynebacterium yudongzhengii TaxID=2080740 RepID=A0A2U1T6F0_9CORY|nr:monovalent cation/H+ antiporter complex subunit F [Corynebacterium yudongzhengii]AWB81652.1 pesticidal protein Cry26Aa [Corynebacterium yudongzhengii]PWC01545.1 pesticidal protein Cry26Aa [Corynebacterium yudongzhengii]
MAIIVGMIILGITCIPAAYRMLIGPTAADRAAAADLLLVAVVGLLALLGFQNGSNYIFDIVLVAALVGFISAISLARALTGGIR